MDIGNVAFKAYLYKSKLSETHDEVRWFHVDQNAVVSVELVKQKLVSTFPKLGDNDFKLYWKDCDDDLVLISTDTELLIALTNSATEPRRLYIYLENSKDKDNNPANSSDIHHVGVVCDGCGGEVHGFRYKCIECPDFDLCSQCESNGAHAEHCFLRLTDIVATRRLRKCLAAGRKIFKYSDRETGRSGRRHGAGGRHGWYEVLSQFVNDINSTLTEEDIKTDATGKDEKAEKSAKAEGASSDGKNPLMGSTPKDSKKDGDGHVNYLKNIGQTIASLLDPLGIDVDVEVRSKNNNEEKKENEKPAQQEDKPKPSTSYAEFFRPTEVNDTNRAIPVFSPSYVPIYVDNMPIGALVTGPADPDRHSKSDAAFENNPSTENPQVQVGMTAFVNGVPVYSTTGSTPTSNSAPKTSTASEPKEKKGDAESGWTLLDDGETSTASDDASNASNKPNAGDGDKEQAKPAGPEQAIPPPTYSGAYPNVPQYMPTFMPSPLGMNPYGATITGYPPVYINAVPPTPSMHPPHLPPLPNFVFDHMNREIQRHMQTHFPDPANAPNMNNPRPPTGTASATQTNESPFANIFK